MREINQKGVFPVLAVLIASTLIMNCYAQGDANVEFDPGTEIEQPETARHKMIIRENLESKNGEFDVVAMNQGELSSPPQPMVCNRKRCEYSGKIFSSKSDVSMNWQGKKTFSITNAFGESILGDTSGQAETLYHFTDENHVWLGTLQKSSNQKGIWELEYTPSPWVETLVAFAGLQSMQAKPHWRNRALIAGAVLTTLAIAGKIVHSRYFSAKPVSSTPPLPVPVTTVSEKKENKNSTPSSSSSSSSHSLPSTTTTETKPKPSSSRKKKSSRPEFRSLPNNPLYDFKTPLSDAAKKHYKAKIEISDAELKMLDNAHKEFRQIYLDGIPGDVIPREELKHVLSALYFDTKLTLLLQDSSVLGELYDLNQDKSLDAEGLMEARMKVLQDAMDGIDREDYIHSRLKGQPKMARLYKNGIGEDVYPLEALQKAMQQHPAEFSDEVADFFENQDELDRIKKIANEEARLTYILSKMKKVKSQHSEKSEKEKSQISKEAFFKRVPEAEAVFVVGFQEEFIAIETFQALMLTHSADIHSTTIQEIFVESNLEWILQHSESPKEAESELVRQIKLQSFFKKVPGARAIYKKEFPAEIIPGPDFREFISKNSALITKDTLKVFSEDNLNGIVEANPDQVNAEKELLRRLKLASQNSRGD